MNIVLGFCENHFDCLLAETMGPLDGDGGGGFVGGGSNVVASNVGL